MICHEAFLPALRVGHNLHQHHQAAWRAYACGRHDIEDRKFIFTLRDIGKHSYLHLRSTDPFPGSAPRSAALPGGTPLTVRVKLHPVHTVTQTNSQTGKVTKNVRLVPLEKQVSWGREMLETRGMSVENIHIVSAKIWKWGKPGHPGMTFLVNDFEAKITVREPALFQDAWIHGFGKRKAYGLGMLVEVNS